jgi:hypothetical protein
VLTEGALGRATLYLKFLRACSQARPPSMIADPRRPRTMAQCESRMHAHVAVRRGQAPATASVSRLKPSGSAPTRVPC